MSEAGAEIIRKFSGRSDILVHPTLGRDGVRR